MNNKRLSKSELEILDKFDEEFGEKANETSSLDLYDFYEYVYDDIKDFLIQSIREEKKEVVSEIWNELPNHIAEPKTNYERGHNHALRKVRGILNKLK